MSDKEQKKCNTLIHASEGTYCNEDVPCKWHGKKCECNCHGIMLKVNTPAGTCQVTCEHCTINSPSPTKPDDSWESRLQFLFKTDVKLVGKIEGRNVYTFEYGITAFEHFILQEKEKSYNEGLDKRLTVDEIVKKGNAHIEYGRQSAYSEIIKIIEGKRLIEASFSSTSLMWKQRTNRKLDEIIELLKDKLSQK